MDRALWTILAVGLALGAWGCGDDDTDADDAGTDSGTDTDSDSDVDLSVDVIIDGADAVPVVLADLATTTVTTEEDGDRDVVLLTDILAEAGISAGDVDSCLLDFEGSDGWAPEGSDNCVDVVPVSGVGDQGGVEPATRDLYWDSALGFPGCMNVGGLAIIYATLVDG